MKRKIAYSVISLALIMGAFFVGKNTAEPVVETETKVISVIPKNYINTESEDFIENYIDMREIDRIKVVGNTHIIYLANGNYYMWTEEE